MRSAVGTGYGPDSFASYAGARLPGTGFSDAVHSHTGRPHPSVIVPIADAGDPIDHDARPVVDDGDRFVSRFDWTGNGVGGMTTKLAACILAVFSGLMAFVPYGSTACGLWIGVPIFVTLLSAAMMAGFVALLLASIIEYRLAVNKDEVYTVDENVVRTEDRRFTIFYSFLGAFVYTLVLFVNLTWLVRNWDIDTKSELAGQTGQFVSEPFAATAAMSSVLAAFVSGAFVVMLYTNVVTRHNRDVMNRSISERP